MQPTALLIGNSDGIGLAMTQRLLANGWAVTGISRSDSSVRSAAYRHHTADVRDGRYPQIIEALLQESSVDLCVYFAGIGELLSVTDMQREAEIIDVNQNLA